MATGTRGVAGPHQFVSLLWSHADGHRFVRILRLLHRDTFVNTCMAC